MMTMPHASASLIPIPEHDDSVENDKDFAPPPKKLKGEEEDNTPVVPMSQDSVEENDKDFAKLKGEEEEEDHTPVVPMSQDSGEEDNSSVPKSQDSGEEEVPKSQDSPYIWAGYAVDSDLEEEKEAPSYTEKEARDAFDLWRQLFLVKEYADQSEYEKRFKFFNDSLHRRVSRCWRSNAMNMIDLADRSPQEIRAAGDYCSISIEELYDFYEENKDYLFLCRDRHRTNP